MSMETTFTISGGGLRSVAGLGSMKYLLDNGYNINEISGTSGGAIISYMYSKGMQPEEILDFIKGFRKKDVFIPTKKSIFSMKKLENELQKMKKGFHTELTVCATKLDTGSPVYFNSNFVKEETMLKAVIASSTIVPLFPVVEIGKKNYYVDGGYSDNLPNIVFGKEKFNISVNVNNLHNEISFSPIELTSRLLMTIVNSNIRCAQKRADIFINVKTLSEMGLFDFDKIDFAYEEGYKAAEKAFTEPKEEEYITFFQDIGSIS